MIRFLIAVAISALCCTTVLGDSDALLQAIGFATTGMDSTQLRAIITPSAIALRTDLTCAYWRPRDLSGVLS